MALYRNNRDGTFTDVTKEAGLAVPMFGISVTAAITTTTVGMIYLYRYGHDHLFHNNHGVFTDVTARAGVAGDSEWHRPRCSLITTTTANWICLCVPIADGRLPTTCFFQGGEFKPYGSPDVYPALTNHLYHNNGDGTFTDVTRKANIYNMHGKAMGVAMCDYNGDGFPDIVVACDDTNNMLYRNNANGTFTKSHKAGHCMRYHGKKSFRDGNRLRRLG